MLVVAIALLAGLWLALLLAAPALPAPLSAAVYAFGSLICHQQPERSFHLAAFQLPVCARCFGIYAGAAAGTLAAAWLRPKTTGPNGGTRRRMARVLATRRWSVTLAAGVPTMATFALEWIGAWQPSNATRALAGVPLGFAVALVLMRATVHYGECAPRRPIAPSPPPPSI